MNNYEKVKYEEKKNKKSSLFDSNKVMKYIIIQKVKNSLSFLIPIMLLIILGCAMCGSSPFITFCVYKYKARKIRKKYSENNSEK